MTVRSLVVAVVWVTAGSSVVSAMATTPTALSNDQRAAVFGNAKMSSEQDVGGNARVAAASEGVGVDALHG